MDEHLEVFFGDATPAIATVYAEYTGDCPTTAELTGHITGPHCEYAQTLPATIVFQDLGRGRSLLAAAKVPDPCFWSPEMPFLYDVNLELREAGQRTHQSHRLFGIPPIGVQRDSLYHNHRRWVLRGAVRGPELDGRLEDHRGQRLAICCNSPPDDFCEQASRIGVFVVACVSTGGQQDLDQTDVDQGSANKPSDPARDMQQELRRLSRWPAVRMVVFRDDDPPHPDRRPRNLLLGRWITTGDDQRDTAWADFVLHEGASVAELIARLGTCGRDRPILVHLTGNTPATAVMARASCDRLQRELAPHGDFAGYIA